MKTVKMKPWNCEVHLYMFPNQRKLSRNKYYSNMPKTKGQYILHATQLTQKFLRKLPSKVEKYGKLYAISNFDSRNKYEILIINKKFDKLKEWIWGTHYFRYISNLPPTYSWHLMVFQVNFQLTSQQTLTVLCRNFLPSSTHPSSSKVHMFGKSSLLS